MKRLLLAAVATLALNSLGSTYYVDYVNGTDDAEHGGAEGSGAWKTLAYALASESVVDGDEIVLAPGDHDFSGTMTVDKAVTIRGTGAPIETTIRGGNRFVVSVAGAFVHSLRLDNIMVGQTSSIELSGNSTISNAVISHVGGSNGSACGLAQSAGLLTHVAITNCPSIGFMWGGLVSLTGSAVMEDCVVADNVVSKGNAVKVNGTSVIVRNCTIVRNTLQVAGSAALGMAQAGKVYNTIIWGNTDGTATANWSGSTANWDTNCTYPLTGVTDPNTIGEGPNFQSDGLHPKFTSPCNHTGNPELATTTDIEGNVRGDKPSIGAYEYVDRGELEVSATASASFVRAPNEIVLTPTVIGSYVGQLSYAWDLDGDGEPEETTPTVTLSEVGSYQPTLVVHDEGSVQGSYTFGAPIAIHVEGKGTCYVDYAGGSDANNGLTDQTPWKNLAFALASPMVVDGDEIVLAKGSHSFSGMMTVDKAVTIRGTGAPTETVFGNGERLDVSAEGAFIHSLSLVNIHRSGFDSISLSGDSTISNAVISNVGGEGSVSGLGLAAGLLTHSAVTNSPGVLRMWNGLVSISGTGTMEDCLVADNEVTDGNAVRVSGSGATVRNCTIVRNLQKSGSAALGMTAAGNVYNTIIWGNTDGTRAVN